MSTVGRSGVGRRGYDASMTTITYARATTPKAPRSSRPPWGPTASSSSITTYVAADPLVRGPTDTPSAGRCITRTPITRRARRLIVCATSWGQMPRRDCRATCRSTSGGRFAARCGMRRSRCATLPAWHRAPCAPSSCATRSAPARSTTSCTSAGSVGASPRI